MKPDDLAAELGHPAGLGVAAQVVGDAVLPEIGPVDARDLLVDAGDGVDVDVGQRADDDVRRLRRAWRLLRTLAGPSESTTIAAADAARGGRPTFRALAAARARAANVSWTRGGGFGGSSASLRSGARTPTGLGHSLRSSFPPHAAPCRPCPSPTTSPPRARRVRDDAAFVTLDRPPLNVLDIADQSRARRARALACGSRGRARRRAARRGRPRVLRRRRDRGARAANASARCSTRSTTCSARSSSSAGR